LPRVRHPRRLVLLIGLFLLALFPFAGPPAVASPRASGVTVASEKTFATPAVNAPLTREGGGTSPGGDVGQTGPDTLLYTSDVIDAGQLFDRVGVHWRAAPGTEDRFFVELRTSSNGTNWTDWDLLSADEDMANTDTNEWYASPHLAADNARYAQYRVWLTDGDPTSDRAARERSRWRGERRRALVHRARCGERGGGRRDEVPLAPGLGR
jgi:hypothetical protein